MNIRPGLERFSLNQATAGSWSALEAVEGCARAGVPGVGLWREPVAADSLERVAKTVRDAGVRVSSLCRGGFFTTGDAAAENRRAVDETAALGAEVLVLVCGGLPRGSRDVDGARARIRDGIAELVPYAQSAGVRLGVEALHPMFCSDRSAVATLDLALDLAEPFPADVVGVVVDAYNIWWDPNVHRAIARASGRILSYQVSDWVTPLPAGALQGRGLPGDGCVDFRGLGAAVDAAGYTGLVEVEIFDADLSARPGDEVLALVCDRYLQHVA